MDGGHLSTWNRAGSLVADPRGANIRPQPVESHAPIRFWKSKADTNQQRAVAQLAEADQGTMSVRRLVGAALTVILFGIAAHAATFTSCPADCRIELTNQAEAHYILGADVVCSISSISLSGGSVLTFSGGGLNVSQSVEIRGSSLSITSPAAWTPIYVNIAGDFKVMEASTMNITYLILSVNGTLGLYTASTVNGVGGGGPGSVGGQVGPYADCQYCPACVAYDANSGWGPTADGGNHAVLGGSTRITPSQTYDNPPYAPLYPPLHPGCGGGAAFFMASYLRGGNGGGAFVAYVGVLEINDAVIDVSGEDGTNGGGGAGGSILIVARRFPRGTSDTLAARGGSPGPVMSSPLGAGGAAGIIVITSNESRCDYDSMAGVITGGVSGTFSGADNGNPKCFSNQPFTLPAVLRDASVWVLGNGTVVNGTYGAVRGSDQCGSGATGGGSGNTAPGVTLDNPSSSSSAGTSTGAAPTASTTTTTTSSTTTSSSSPIAGTTGGTQAATTTASTTTGSSSADTSTTSADDGTTGASGDTLTTSPTTTSSNGMDELIAPPPAAPPVQASSLAGAIAGGVCAALLIGGLIIWLVVRRRRNTRQQPPSDNASLQATQRAPPNVPQSLPSESTSRGTPLTVLSSTTPVASSGASDPARQVTTRGSLPGAGASDSGLPPRSGTESTTRGSLSRGEGSARSGSTHVHPGSLPEETMRDTPIEAGHWERTQRGALVSPATSAAEPTVRASTTALTPLLPVSDESTLRGLPSAPSVSANGGVESTMRGKRLSGVASSERTLRVSHSGLLDPEQTLRTSQL